MVVPHSEEVSTQPSSREIMATALCGLGGNLHGDYMKHKTTTAGDAYAAVLRYLREVI
jgi:hypothetical protein